MAPILTGSWTARDPRDKVRSRGFAKRSGVDDKELAEREARELRRLQNRHWVGPRFALDDGRYTGPGAGHVQWRRACASGVLAGLGHAIGHLVGGRDYHDRLRTATFAREVLERSGELKRDWNRQVERAAEEGIHVIYTDGYDRLHKELDTVSKNMLLDRGVESEISAVLAQLGKVVSNRNYFGDCREYMAGQMDRREALVAKAAELGVPVPDHGGLRHMAGRDRLCGGPLRRNSWTTR